MLCFLCTDRHFAVLGIDDATVERKFYRRFIDESAGISYIYKTACDGFLCAELLLDPSPPKIFRPKHNSFPLSGG